MHDTWNEMSWIRPCGHWAVVTCYLRNRQLSIPTLGMARNDDEFTLATCIDGTSIPELLGSFSRTSFSSFHPSPTVHHSNYSSSNSCVDVTRRLRSAWLSGGAVSDEWVNIRLGLISWAQVLRLYLLGFLGPKFTTQ